MNLLKAKRNFRCTDCNYCREAVCPSTDECIGCSACFIACPYNAVDMVKRQATAGIKININGRDEKRFKNIKGKRPGNGMLSNKRWIFCLTTCR